jgi:hypothetical protein
MFEYFYHEILRRTIIGFGSLFNGISIKHVNESKDVTNVIQVPLAYGPTQKFLARLEQVPNLNKPVQITLPRMSFEFVGLTYDPTRKVTTTQTFLSVDKNGSSVRKTFMPVPYNMEFELSIFTILNDDMLQIIEQILPYFQPAYTLTVDLVDKIGEKRDIPIVIDSITMQDNYEGNFDTRRALIYTIRFTAKTYLFGPTSSSDVSKDIIQRVSIGYVTGEQGSGATRDLTYSVEPRALQSYSNNTVTSLASDIDQSSTLLTVNDTSSLAINKYITIDNEELYITSIPSSTTIIVNRGADGTTASSHVSGTEIKLITQSDNSLIPFGDDFGFDGL